MFVFFNYFRELLYATLYMIAMTSLMKKIATVNNHFLMMQYDVFFIAFGEL